MGPTSFLNLRSVVTRETREGCPMPTVETEMNGDSKSTNKRGPSLVDSLVQETFVLPLPLLSAQCKIFFSSSYTISITLSPSPRLLGRQPSWVAYLLVCVSGRLEMLRWCGGCDTQLPTNGWSMHCQKTWNICLFHKNFWKGNSEFILLGWTWPNVWTVYLHSLEKKGNFLPVFGSVLFWVGAIRSVGRLIAEEKWSGGGSDL